MTTEADLIKGALALAAHHLQAKAVAQSDGKGHMDERGAAIWDCAAWLREDAFNEITNRTP